MNLKNILFLGRFSIGSQLMEKNIDQKVNFVIMKQKKVDILMPRKRMCFMSHACQWYQLSGWGVRYRKKISLNMSFMTL